MKKLIYLFVAAAVLFSSCSLEPVAEDTVYGATAIQSMTDVEGFVNGLMIGIRGRSAGSRIYDTEIAVDYFSNCIDNGNREGTFYKWTYTASESLCESLWANAYSTIVNANFLLDGIAKMDKNDLDDDQLAQLTNAKGVAYFAKAYLGFLLCQYYCKPYNPSTAANDMGVMVVDKYNPSADQSSYPGRSSLEASMTWVLDNLALALANTTAAGSVGSENVTKDVVNALWARVALWMGNNNTAIEKSTALISSGKYPLLKTQSDMNALWTNDSGKECIMQMYADYSKSSVPATNDPSYRNYNPNTGVTRPDWFPKQWVLDAYDSKDLRWTTWFLEDQNVSWGSITGVLTLMDKFPGNMSLQASGSTVSAHYQKVKPFRIAEQYLIAAEAYQAKGESGPAMVYMKEFLQNRIPGAVINDLSGDALRDLIRTERAKEFIGEGHRFLDLKRWGMGFTRTASQDDDLVGDAKSTTSALLSIGADNFRWIWPIPQYEIDANPQIKDQQNPGYAG